MPSDLSELIERHPSLFRGEPPRVSSYVPRGWFAQPGLKEWELPDAFDVHQHSVRPNGLGLVERARTPVMH